MTEWMRNNVRKGYHWQIGQKHENIKLWMWSDSCTHDFENGYRVATILLCTQEMIEHRTILKASTSIFALDMMLSSSVQRFDIQEDHLQHKLPQQTIRKTTDKN